MKVLIGKKIGMTQIYKENGAAVPVTVFDVSQNFVTKKLKIEDKVTHLEIGKDKQKKPLRVDLGNYKTLNFVPKFKEIFKIDEETSLLEEGSELKADTFSENDKVDVTGVSAGKGFQGVVKRWGFSGLPGTHGASDRERAPGSIGSRAIPGRVFKGKKMSGHMGAINKTIKNLKIAYIDIEENLIAVNGSVPGSNGTYSIIKSVRVGK